MAYFISARIDHFIPSGMDVNKKYAVKVDEIKSIITILKKKNLNRT